MNPELAAFLAALYRQGRDHDAPPADRLLWLPNMTPQAVGLIATLTQVNGGGRVLESGTSNGYSAIWFGDAVRGLRGRLTSVELDAERAGLARRNLADAGIADVVEVEVEVGNGADVLRDAGPVSFDVIVLDTERPAYPEYLPDLIRVPAPRGLSAVDNSVGHAGQVALFRRLVEKDPRLAVRLHELGDGVLTAAGHPRRRRRSAAACRPRHRRPALPRIG